MTWAGRRAGLAGEGEAVGGKYAHAGTGQGGEYTHVFFGTSVENEWPETLWCACIRGLGEERSAY